MSSLLLVEDTVEVQKVVQQALKAQDLEVSVAANLTEARRLAQSRLFDLILLDVQLPDGDGWGFFSWLRAEGKNQQTPVFFLTSKGELNDKLHGFRLGAEDYITKPFEPLELQARVLNRLKRKEQEQPEVYQFGSLRLKMATQRALIDGPSGEREISLTSLEFRLLHFFARHCDQVLSRKELMEGVWGRDVHVSDRTVDTHVSHLRKKISESRCTIQTVIGAGYAFQAPQAGRRAA